MQQSDILKLVNKLYETQNLEDFELKILIENADEETDKFLAQKADEVRQKIYGREVFLRGLIEISNYCKNNCIYCGIRCGNNRAERYRLTKEQILDCCDVGHRFGLRSFVLQGGEDNFFTDDLMCDIISGVKKSFPDSALTLSLGEKSFDTYKRYYDAGADRYLLRHETATKEHYEKLHPSSMSFDNRMECLKNLKKIGFQTGCGFMVGAPYQTTEHIIADLRFLQKFKPHMIGIGPFIPHCDTPFAEEKAGSATLTVRLLSIIRLMLRSVNLPSTTALGSVEKSGRIRGLKAGANVVMPNISPLEERHKYMLYNNKITQGDETAEGIKKLIGELLEEGFFVTSTRGDYKEE